MIVKSVSPPLVFSIVDSLKVDIEKPLNAVKTYEVNEVETITCDILIVGGGMGGVSAALSALKAAEELGYNSNQAPLVVLTEETDWLGGQMTSQGVSALDENHLVEICGANRSYQTFRESIRNRYKSDFKLVEHAAAEPWLNPGDCWVSWLAFEPKLAVQEIDKLFAPYIKNNLSIKLRYKPVYATTGICLSSGKQSKEVTHVGFIDLESGKCIEVNAKVVIDATELGDLLPLAEIEYRSGAEAHSETGEAHAPEKARPENVQDFTYPFVIELCDKSENCKPIKKPLHYDEFNAKGKFSLQNYPMFATKLRGEGDDIRIEKLPFWEYRRLISSALFVGDEFPRDLAMINWDSNDLRMENIIDVSSEVQAERLALAKALSLGFLYWLQTEAPRDDGGVGYPEFQLRTDIFETEDGLSKYPYIRESRRIVAQHTIVEEEIVAATNSGARAHIFDDTVGIGHYPVDIHGEQDVPGAAQRTKHFQIPLGALIPEGAANFLPACKNIGTTHVTNGSYRLHPIEWAVGEAQGAIAIVSLKNNIKPQELPTSQDLTRALQELLIERGVPLFWFNDVPTQHPDFAAIQKGAVFKSFEIASDTLAFEPDTEASKAKLKKQ